MLKAKPTKWLRYSMFYDKTRAYLIDNKYTDALFSVPKRPDKVTLKGYLLDKDEVSKFDTKPKTIGNLEAVFITMPIVTFIYNFGKSFFRGFDEWYYVLIKIIMLIFALCLMPMANYIYFRMQKKRVTSRLNLPKKIYSFKFYQTDAIRNRPRTSFSLRAFQTLFIATMVLGPLYLYFKIDDGTEIAMLVVVAVVSYFYDTFSKFCPIGAPLYKDYDFSIEACDKQSK